MESSVDKHWVSALPLLGTLVVCIVPALSLRQPHQFALTHKGNYRPPNTFSIPLQLRAPVKRPDLAHTTLPHSVPQIKKSLLHHLRRRRKVPPFTVAEIAATQPQAIHLLHRRRVLGRSNSQFPRPSNPFSTNKGGYQQRKSIDRTQEAIPELAHNRRRVSSLTSRFPGDQSHRPLDMLKHDAKLANRSPHLRKKHIPGPDTIDSLDTIGGSYHHGGPFDATLLARNTSNISSPVQAVRASNMEALRATPVERIKDSVERHRPLDGVATVPPGMPDQSGRVYKYEEGADLMIEDGNYKRWPGVVSINHQKICCQFYANTSSNIYQKI